MQTLGAALQFLVFAALVAAAATIGATFLPGAWYAGLVKPSWTPPNAVFAPVWTLLYVMIAIAGFLAWRSPARGPAVAAWAIGLALNAAWSWLFFGEHRIGAALVDIAALWLSIAVFIAVTWAPRRPAALLFLPYLAWVSFAAALNLALWRLNG